MEKILSFLVENWKELSLIFVALLTFCVSLFKPKGKVNPAFETLLNYVPEAIIKAEESGSIGVAKKRMVMVLLSSAYLKLTGYSLKEGSAIYNSLSKYVEKVLETPHKKEDK